jgi:Fur family ferric uptake transcriptional regulator
MATDPSPAAPVDAVGLAGEAPNGHHHAPGAGIGASPVQQASNAHQMAATKLASVSHRYTANRRAVVDALLGLPGPATIADVLEAGDGLAQSSTYRNLVVLEQVGVVHRIVTSDDHARFELTEEITGEHHHHLICEDCGLIIDVLLDGDLERALEASLGRAAAEHGFDGQHHRVDLVGRCRDCVA